MNETEACHVLGIKQCNPDACEVTRAFRRMSLQAHPDKGGSQSDFIRVTDAREVLLNRIGKHKNRCDRYYHFGIQAIASLAKGVGGCRIECLTIKVTLAQAMDKDVYPHEYESHTYLVPLWHKLSTFFIPGGLLLVRIEIVLPPNVWVLQDNTIHITVRKPLDELIHGGSLTTIMDNRIFVLEQSAILAIPFQCICVSPDGLPSIDETLETVEATPRQCIYIDLYIDGSFPVSS
jgi:hypothetical protein